MKIYSKTPIRVATTRGHSAIIGPTPVDVHPDIAALAFSMGALPVAGHEPDKIEKPSLEETIAAMVDRADPSQFTGNGTPRLKVVKDLMKDATITASQVSTAFDKVMSNEAI